MIGYRDRIVDGTLTEGLGAFALTGTAAPTFFPFAGHVPDGATVQVAVAHPTLNEVEVVEGIYSAGTISRDRVLASSNGGAAVSFSNGLKSVSLTWSAERALQASKYTHTQAVPAAVWTVAHNLNCRPSVRVVDSTDRVVIGDVSYPDVNTLVLTFNGGFSGAAYLN